MPITSERIRVVLVEALAIARASSALVEVCQAGIKMGEAGGLALIQSHLLVNPLPQPVHLLLEQRHQQVSGRRNLRKREKARLKRREAGVPEQPGLAPTTLADLGLLEEDLLQDEFNKWNEGEEVS